MILRREKFLLSGGLAVTVPTAQNTRAFWKETPVRLADPRSIGASDAVFGGLWTPNDRWFGIGYVQVDVDASGDQVTDLEFFTARRPAAGRPLF